MEVASDVHEVGVNREWLAKRSPVSRIPSPLQPLHDFFGDLYGLHRRATSCSPD